MSYVLDKPNIPVIAASFVVLTFVFYPWPGRKLDHIPAVGYKSHFLSFIGGFQFLYKAHELIQKGCDQFGEGVFKIPTFARWKVMVHGEKYIEEIRKAPENVLSFHEAVNEQLQVPFTLGPTIATNPYHIPIVRTSMTRSIPSFFPGLHDEVATVFEAKLPLADNKWIKVKALETMMAVVSRASNYAFVGSPLCRNEGYLNHTVNYTVKVVMASSIMQLFPRSFRPTLSNLFGFEKLIDKGIKYLEPLIEERRQAMKEHGQDYQGKPNDMLSWLMDEANEEEASTRLLTRRMLTVNMAAIHTTSMTFSQVLFDLAAHPEYVMELRAEVEPIIEREGWTYEALNQMIKVDSFIKESQRLNAIGTIIMERVTQQPFVFSDGTIIPTGTFMSVAAQATHTNPKNYEDPHTFRPFRYAEKREQTARKVDIVSTHSDFVAFGHGVHACPGRFFAANELKLMLAHVLMEYDVKLPEGKGRPVNKWYMTACVPDPEAEVFFRKRII